ncbi:hypothetical protein NUW54_g12595 [Trametes sanguinea]|uniref:Uncharacterized protein n=1 Tax=Trametes sanguinea TaxID=158606 RepID=A0ACC1MWK3_9APHY|nr:hypothetical protein NUW54_g12595 [Trametes sanguinea]
MRSPREGSSRSSPLSARGGLAFWVPNLARAFVADCPQPPPGLEDNIFWFEALTVLAALEWVINYVEPLPTRLAIYTDNLNTVQIFDSFKATPSFDELLLRPAQHHRGRALKRALRRRTSICAIPLHRYFHTPSTYAGGITQMLSISLTSRQPVRQPWTFDRLVRERAVALGYAIDKSTRITYTSHVQSYLTFCKIHGFPIDPTIDTLSFYVVFMCHHIKPDSVDSYLSGICNQLEGLYPHVRQNRRSPLVSRTLKGCIRLFNTPPNRKLPLSVENVLNLLQHFPPSCYENYLFRAILVCGFFGLHRLGELVVSDNRQLHDSRKVIKRSSIRVFDDNFSYVLPTHKAQPYFQGHHVLISADHPDVNPVIIFKEYLDRRDARFRFHSALWITTDGKHPSRAWFLARLRHVLPPTYAGHSLRAGGATYFAARGWSDDRIQALGRWSSEAYRIYIRENPVVLQALLHGRVLQRS